MNKKFFDVVKKNVAEVKVIDTLFEEVCRVDDTYFVSLSNSELEDFINNLDEFIEYNAKKGYEVESITIRSYNVIYKLY